MSLYREGSRCLSVRSSPRSPRRRENTKRPVSPRLRGDSASLPVRAAAHTAQRQTPSRSRSPPRSRKAQREAYCDDSEDSEDDDDTASCASDDVSDEDIEDDRSYSEEESSSSSSSSSESPVPSSRRRSCEELPSRSVHTATLDCLTAAAHATSKLARQAGVSREDDICGLFGLWILDVYTIKQRKDVSCLSHFF